MKKSVCWFLAVIITLALSIYQRMTGPTHPKKVDIELRGDNYQIKLPRSGVQKDEIVTLKDITAVVKSQLHYRRYPTTNDYTTVDFQWTGAAWQAALPVQPIAGKLQYYLTVDGKDYLKDEPVIIRFRNDVPAYILIPHILLMFGAMLFAVYTFLLVVTRKEYRKWLKITVATLFVGGFIFGPLVQHAAFGPWWTGFPYGTDLTDNKTLISFLFFLAALATLKWKYNKWIVSLAVLAMIAVFTIPHSAYGSEYDYEKQKLGIEELKD
ncbi:MAG: hypothetical protein IJ577_02200 [Prevotella sp.]|nr:hypothetical protein [Prevotella sp.]